jgi:peptide/nickel transport system substrate-binding protein
VARDPDVRTVFAANPKWWDRREHNLDRVVMTPIASDPTRVAALLSGQIDLAFPVPPQDLARVTAGRNTTTIVGPELRTIFLGLDQFRDALLYSDVKGKNPFKDRRVRLALYQAIDIAAIASRVMRDQAIPSAMMIGPGVAGFDPAIQRYPFDPDAARRLLAEAGYPNGFRLTLDCPNDRYVNDEQICQALVPMLARIGVRVDVNALPRAPLFGKLLPPRRDTSFYLLGWVPGSYDSHNPLFALHTCVNDRGGGPFNIGGYCNPELDRLAGQILVEMDGTKRANLVAEAWQIAINDVAYLPLHQQRQAWGVRRNLRVAQRADGILAWRRIVMP